MPSPRREEFPRFTRTMADLRRLQTNLYKYQANIAVNFFKDSFRRKGFIDTSYSRWKGRKEPKSKKKPRGTLMVVSGRLRNSIRTLEIMTDGIRIGTDVPYAEVHNDGSDKEVTVKEHTRVSTRKAKIRGGYSGTARKTRAKTIRLRGAEHTVKSHSYKQNIPQREFIGDSEVLFQRIEKHTLDALETFFLDSV